MQQQQKQRQQQNSPEEKMWFLSFVCRFFHFDSHPFRFPRSLVIEWSFPFRAIIIMVSDEKKTQNKKVIMTIIMIILYVSSLITIRSINFVLRKLAALFASKMNP